MITDKIPIYDSYLFLQELLYASEGGIPKLYIVSPWIKSLRYYLKSAGIILSLYRETLPDNLRTEDFIELLSQKNTETDFVIITSPIDKNKYETIYDIIDELEFLIEMANLGSDIYFWPHHKKYFLTTFGVITGSANYTPSGRYFSEENTFFFDSSSAEYSECLTDIEVLVAKSKSYEDKTIPFLREILKKYKCEF